MIFSAVVVDTAFSIITEGFVCIQLVACVCVSVTHYSGRWCHSRLLCSDNYSCSYMLTVGERTALFHHTVCVYVNSCVPFITKGHGEDVIFRILHNFLSSTLAVVRFNLYIFLVNIKCKASVKSCTFT